MIAILAALGGPSRKFPKLKVLIIDVDSQQNISYLFLKALGAKMINKRCRLPANPRCPNKEIYNITDMVFGNECINYPTGFSHIDILPSDGNIDKLRMEAPEYHKHDENQLIANTSVIFDEIIQLLSEDYDVIVIDTPPSRSAAAVSALSASTHAIAVCELHDFSVEMGVPGVMSDIEYSNNFLKHGREKTRVLGIIPNKISSVKMTNDEKRNHALLLNTYPDFYSSNLYFTQRVSLSINIPQDSDTFPWMKDSVALNQMNAFYKHLAQNVFLDLYKESMTKEASNG